MLLLAAGLAETAGGGRGESVGDDAPPLNESEAEAGGGGGNGLKGIAPADDSAERAARGG